MTKCSRSADRQYTKSSSQEDPVSCKKLKRLESRDENTFKTITSNRRLRSLPDLKLPPWAWVAIKMIVASTSGTGGTASSPWAERHTTLLRIINSTTQATNRALAGPTLAQFTTQTRLQRLWPWVWSLLKVANSNPVREATLHRLLVGETLNVPVVEPSSTRRSEIWSALKKLS